MNWLFTLLILWNLQLIADDEVDPVTEDEAAPLEEMQIESAQESSQDEDVIVFGGKTSIKNPMELRDPFKAPVVEAGKKTEDARREGFFSNLSDPDEVSLNDIKILGVVVGKNRRAVANSAGKENFILKEGMTIQGGKVELKAIIPGGVIFVEQITNIYGQTEYLETIVPISK